MGFALSVGGDNMCPIVRSIPWGEPWMLARCHIMAHTTYWVVYLACSSFSLTSEKLCMDPGPPKLRHATVIGMCEQGLDAHTGAGCMHGLNNPFQAPGVDKVHRLDLPCRDNLTKVKFQRAKKI